jgi:hypothetical protein
MRYFCNTYEKETIFIEYPVYAGNEIPAPAKIFIISKGLYR